MIRQKAGKVFVIASNLARDTMGLKKESIHSDMKGGGVR
jgi:hypothetical protein